MILTASISKGVPVNPTEQSEKSQQASKESVPAAACQTATFAAGCFWGVEHAFSLVPGVKDVQVGFMGGRVEKPSYKRVCVGDTHHAEVVQFRYDPNQVSYERLVRIFFLVHDPTTLNRQGPDVGTQYRSAIFTHSDEQQKTAAAVKDALEKSGRFQKPIVTEIVPATTFWKAEEYHQDYVRKNPGACHVIDMKKVLKETAQ
jgi:peptide-methionine (S)-S-oxide reductase